MHYEVSSIPTPSSAEVLKLPLKNFAELFKLPLKSDSSQDATAQGNDARKQFAVIHETLKPSD